MSILRCWELSIPILSRIVENSPPCLIILSQLIKLVFTQLHIIPMDTKWFNAITQEFALMAQLRLPVNGQDFYKYFVQLHLLVTDKKLKSQCSPMAPQTIATTLLPMHSLHQILDMISMHFR